jgi:diamine N-acetyltransferase
MQLSIHRATLPQLAVIRALSITTFYDTFAQQNTAVDMEAYLQNALSEQQLSVELQQTDTTFYIAYDGDTAVGYAKVRTSPAPEGVHATNPLEIERLYALHTYHGAGVGQALMQQCMEHAVANHNDAVWLGVWEHNPRAIRFYEKWGFVAFGTHPFVLGTDVQTDVLMQRPTV